MSPRRALLVTPAAAWATHALRPVVEARCWWLHGFRAAVADARAAFGDPVVPARVRLACEQLAAWLQMDPDTSPAPASWAALPAARRADLGLLADARWRGVLAPILRDHRTTGAAFLQVWAQQAPRDSLDLTLLANDLHSLANLTRRTDPFLPGGTEAQVRWYALHEHGAEWLAWHWHWHLPPAEQWAIVHWALRTPDDQRGGWPQGLLRACLAIMAPATLGQCPRAALARLLAHPDAEVRLLAQTRVLAAMPTPAARRSAAAGPRRPA